MTGADYASETDETCTNDANGNRTNVARGSASGTPSTIGTLNRILNERTSTFTYVSAGNRISKTEIATGSKVTDQWCYHTLLRVGNTG